MALPSPPTRPAPKKVSWVVLSIGGVLFFILFLAGIWRLQLAHRVDRQLGAIRAADLPASGAELNAWYRAVPCNQNAALVLTQAFALLRTFPDQRSNQIARFRLSLPGQRITPQQIRLLSDYLRTNADTLARAREALTLPQARFPVDYTPGLSALLPHLSPIKKLAWLFRGEALLAFDAHRSSDAGRSIEAMLGCARSLEAEPDLIAQVLRIAALAMATSSLEYGLGGAPLAEEDLSRLAAAFATAERTNLIARALVGERAMALPAFYRVSGEAGRWGRHDDEEEPLPIIPIRPIRRASLWRAAGFFERDLAFYLEAMETNIGIANLPLPERLPATRTMKRQSQEAKWKACILSSMLLGYLSPAVAKEAEGLALVRMSLAALAIERFRLAEGRRPASLDEIAPRYLPTVPVDPCDGQPIRFRPLPKGYMVYSVGRDGQDNGGLRKPAGVPASQSPPYDLTFLVERPAGHP
jgi:hypothetical protein